MNIAQLRAANDYGSLASLFDVSPALLKAALYASSGHKIFSIPKKSGGIRLITRPSKIRRDLQAKLLPALVEFYKVPSSVNGFVAKKSVVSNASPHVARRTVANIDLLDFFPSITFQRVRGIFLSRPLGLDWTVANILAQLCCCDGVLSTGGVTSPIVSNIACARLDKRLLALASRLGGVYSRYADDITMSFDRPLSQISSIIIVDDIGKASCGAAISEIVSSEGFAVNEQKIRVSTGAARKIVTGLVVNERVNVKRSWYRALESKIYAIEQFGLDAVSSEEFPEIRDPSIRSRKLVRKVHGKVSYLSMVRGRQDWVVARLADRLNHQHEYDDLRLPSVELVTRSHRTSRSTLIVNCSADPLLFFDGGHSQGTAFVTPSGLIVTAAHVVAGQDEPGGATSALRYVYVMSEGERRLVRCDVLAFDGLRDVAILKPQASRLKLERCRLQLGPDPLGDTKLTTVGYPNYFLGNVASRLSCDVVRLLVDAGVRKADVDGAIQGGLSGGPVLDSELCVRGMVHKGVRAVGGIAQMVQVSEIHRAAIAAGLTL